MLTLYLLVQTKNNMLSLLGIQQKNLIGFGRMMYLNYLKVLCG